jgi:hypothetical protein
MKNIPHWCPFSINIRYSGIFFASMKLRFYVCPLGPCGALLLNVWPFGPWLGFGAFWGPLEIGALFNLVWRCFSAPRTFVLVASLPHLHRVANAPLMLFITPFAMLTAQLIATLIVLLTHLRCAQYSLLLRTLFVALISCCAYYIAALNSTCSSC